MTKSLTYAVLVICIISSCDNPRLPSDITSQLSDSHFQMKNTQLFVVKPQGYTYTEDVNLFKHADSTFIYCITAPVNFYTSLNNNQFDFLFNKAYSIVDEQEFTINELPGVYFELQEDDKRYHYFYFGDSLVENLIIGVTPKESDQLPNILEFVKKSYYDEYAVVSSLEGAKFKLSPSKIGFQFETNTMNQFIYFEEGFEKYMEQGKEFNSISISQLPRNSSVDAINEIFDTMVSQLVNQGLEMTGTLFNDTLTIDGNYAKAIAFEATYQFSTRIVYMLIAGKNNTIVNVAGNFHHDGLKLVPKIHALASEMKIIDDNK